MVDFGDMKDKAQDFIAEHDDQVKEGIEKVGDFVGDKIGHDKVDGIEDKLSGFVDKLAGNDAVDAPAEPEAQPKAAPEAAPKAPPAQ